MTHATREGTQRLAARHVEQGARADAWRTLGRTGLHVACVGFGTYRVSDESPRHARALEKALLAGFNLVDTSTNYTDGGSETCVGDVLERLASREAVRRDEVVLVSKVGYVQGRNLSIAQRREREGRPVPEMVKYADGCWHCLHPEWIADQLDRTLERLRVPSVDAYLLHNPEYFLADLHHRGGAGSLEDIRTEFYRRVKEAFRRLEEEADAGRLAWYGVSSNTFTSPAHDPEATSLSRMVELARDVARERGGDPERHRFAVVQLPMNLVERGAALERNNGPVLERTVLEEAARHGLGVLVNRPLNAFADGRLVRLSDFPEQAKGVTVDEAARRVGALEDEFRARIAPSLAEEGGGPSTSPVFNWGAELAVNARRFGGLDHWRQAEDHFIRPRLEHLLEHYALHLVGRVRNDWAAWRARYEPEVDVLLAAVGDLHRREAQGESDRMNAALAPLLPPEWRNAPLSRKAVAALAATPGVHCVLLGMRRDEYVEDALPLLRQPLPPWDAAAHAALAPPRRGS